MHSIADRKEGVGCGAAPTGAELQMHMHQGENGATLQIQAYAVQGMTAKSTHNASEAIALLTADPALIFIFNSIRFCNNNNIRLKMYIILM